MIAALLQLGAASLATIVHLSHGSSSSGGELLLLASGPIVGALVYGAIYRRYRNSDKSFNFERETVVAQTAPVTGSDTKIGETKGTRESRIEGGNSDRDRQRVQRLKYPEA